MGTLGILSVLYEGNTATGVHMGRTQRAMRCRRQRAPYLVLLPARARMRELPNVVVQGLELLVTVLLARNRQPPPTVAAGVPHAEFAAGLILLPSGLLAMVCEAIVKRKVRLEAACERACLRTFRLRGPSERADEIPPRARCLCE
jgi:hypothetical protein